MLSLINESENDGRLPIWFRVTTTETFDQKLCDADPSVRKSLAADTATPPELLLFLSFDDDSEIASLANQRLQHCPDFSEAKAMRYAGTNSAIDLLYEPQPRTPSYSSSSEDNTSIGRCA